MVFKDDYPSTPPKCRNFYLLFLFKAYWGYLPINLIFRHFVSQKSLRERYLCYLPAQIFFKPTFQCPSPILMLFPVMSLFLLQKTVTHILKKIGKVGVTDCFYLSLFSCKIIAIFHLDCWGEYLWKGRHKKLGRVC